MNIKEDLSANQRQIIQWLSTNHDCLRAPVVHRSRCVTD